VIVLSGIVIILALRQERIVVYTLIIVVRDSPLAVAAMLALEIVQEELVVVPSLETVPIFVLPLMRIVTQVQLMAAKQIRTHLRQTVVIVAMSVLQTVLILMVEIILILAVIVETIIIYV
jgi:hypothetical protein